MARNLVLAALLAALCFYAFSPVPTSSRPQLLRREAPHVELAARASEFASFVTDVLTTEVVETTPATDFVLSTTAPESELAVSSAQNVVVTVQTTVSSTVAAESTFAAASSDANTDLVAESAAANLRTTASSQDATSDVITTFTSSDGGQTVVVTQTSVVTSATASSSQRSSSGGLSNTNKIVVGVVVGVGGAFLVGLIALVFILKRRGSRGQESGWTFWRKNNKGGDDNFFSGELGVRDRDINQGSNF